MEGVAEVFGGPAAFRFRKKVANLRDLCGLQKCVEAEEAQNQEIEVLESIYGDSIELLSAQDERPTLLRVEVPVALNAGTVQLMIETPDGQVPAGSIEELLPSVLLIALPPHYPLEGPAVPALALEAAHLGSADVDSLEHSLQGEVEQNTGIFDWICKLQEELHVSDRIVLTQEMFPQEDPMEVAMKLLQHDRRAKQERRQRESQVCPMCFDELPGSRGIFLSCGHFGCRDCLQQMANIHTSEADVTALRCPVPDCREGFDGDVLRQLLGSDSPLLQKWEELSLKHCLDTMEDIVYCPRCDLEGDGQRIPCIQDDDHMARCEVCGFVFCGRCRSVYHPGQECASADDRMEALEARAAGAGPQAAAARAELLTLRHLAKTTKKCPKCCMGIEKTEGCSKVLCGNCKIHFCWRCGQVISGYDHFATSECRLFDDEEIRRWNQRVHQVDKAQARAHEARFLAQFIDPEQLRQQSRECPRCRAPVLREGKNNHLRCYACMTQFCARCFEVLPKGKASEHFNKLRICPQHSDD